MPSISNFYETALLEVLRTLAAGAGVWVKLHVGDPGEDCTANAAAETGRRQVTFAAAVGNAMANDNTLTWASVAAPETISHASLWNSVGPAGGDALWAGTITVPRALQAGDSFEIAVGNLVVSLD